MITVWGSQEGSFIGASRPGIFYWPSGGAFAPVTPIARGNIDFDQIRVAARTGNGTQLLTWQFPGPGAHNSNGTIGMTAYDNLGNFYWCYGTNQWARIGPGGYSNTF